jgi:hypothetical protein
MQTAAVTMVFGAILSDVRPASESGGPPVLASMKVEPTHHNMGRSVGVLDQRSDESSRPTTYA